MFALIKKGTLIFVLMLSSLAVYADEITFSVSVDRNKIALNEYLVYSLTISGEAANLPEPKTVNFTDFVRYGTSKSQNISFVNGKRSGRVTYSYTLGPKTTGKFTIPSATVVYDNKTYIGDPVEIEIIEAAKIQSSQAQQAETSSRQRVNNAGRSGDTVGNVFVKAATDKKNAYVNEKIKYKFSFYTNVDLVSNPQYYAPDFTGFWNDSSQPGSRYETVEGVKYHVSEIETTLYPIESGKITINPAKLKIAVMDFSSTGDMDDFFNLFVNMGQRKERILESNAVTVNIAPLPQEGKPAEFKGAVGNFKISASLDKSEVQTDELVTLAVKVTGKGNMKSVNDLDFKSGKDFKVYDTVSSNVTEESKEFQILLVPLTPGEKTIPPLKLYSFDPSKKEYLSSETLPLKIKVSGAAVASTDSSYNAINSNITKLQSDINYNKQVKKICSYGGYFIRNKLFSLIFVPFVLFFAAALFYRFYSSKKNNDPVFKLKAEADELSKKCIINASGKVDSETCHEFYENAHEAMIYSITAKTGIPSENLPVAEIAANLERSKFDKEKLKDIEELLNRLNFYRFASVKSDEISMRKLLGEIKEIINILRKS